MTSTATGPGDRDQGPGSGAWFDRWATQYDAERRLLISPFDAYYAAAAEVRRSCPVRRAGAARTRGADGGPIRVLDLGAGTGLLTAALAEALPGAHLTLLDEAEGMLAQARDRFAGAHRRPARADRRRPARRHAGGAVRRDRLRPGDPPPGSRRAGAHLRGATRAARRSGVFVNAEQLHAPAQRVLEDHYIERELVHARAGGFTPEAEEQAWIRWSIDQHVDLETQLRWLHEAGYAVVDCAFKSWRFAVVAGWR